LLLDQTCFSRGLVIFQGRENILWAPKLVFISQNSVSRLGRFRGRMDAHVQSAGFAIDGRDEIAENGVFVSPMCDIPAGSGGLFAASENSIAVSHFCAAIVVCLRTRW